MKVEIKTTATVNLKIDIKDLEILYNKLVKYCSYNPKDWEEIHPDTNAKYYSRSPVDEVEEFLQILHRTISNYEFLKHP